MSWQKHFHYDDQYLFRLTSTFGWDDAISLCECLATGIEKAAARAASSRYRCRDDDEEDIGDGEGGVSSCRLYYNDSLFEHMIQSSQQDDIESLEERLLQAHAQLSYVDQWGNRPLHAASYVKPPPDVIGALFGLGRALWRHGPRYRARAPLWAAPCNDGSSPFLVACSTGASTAVLNRYLDEIEYYIDQGWVRDPKLARMVVVRPDNQGITPLAGWMSFHLNMSNRETGLPAEYWNLARRILTFATMNIHPRSPPSTPVLVHRCAAIAPHCPLSLLKWVVTPREDDNEAWVPADLSAATIDTLGKLPMHRAIEATDLCSNFDEDIVCDIADFNGMIDATSCHKISATMPPAKTVTKATTLTTAAAETLSLRKQGIIYNNAKQEKNRVSIIKKLLQWHPQAAKTPFPNMRSPLIQAIAHGGTWHELGYNDGTNDSDSNITFGLLQLLWGYDPEQLLKADPVTGLYPFMLAATIPSGQGVGNGLGRDHETVDTVYNLLRKEPQLVTGALGASNTAVA